MSKVIINLYKDATEYDYSAIEFEAKTPNGRIMTGQFNSNGVIYIKGCNHNSIATALGIHLSCRDVVKLFHNNLQLTNATLVLDSKLQWY